MVDISSDRGLFNINFAFPLLPFIFDMYQYTNESDEENTYLILDKQFIL